MQGQRIGTTCLTLLGGLVAVSIAAADSASAAPAMGSVCAMKTNGPQWYATAAEAKKDKARIMHPGDCDTVLCMGVWPKVVLAMHIIPSTAICGTDPLTRVKMTYPNNCAIEAAGATWIHSGPCK
jgi:hypothetical protein